MLVALLLALSGCQDAPVPNPNERAVALLESLGDANPEVRERSLVELRNIVSAIKPLLQDNVRNSDPEIAARCRDLLAETERLQHVFKARVIHTDARFNFILADLAAKPGLAPGAPFEIYRVQIGKEPLRLGSAEFEKHLGAERLISKLRMTKGSAADVRPDDIVMPPIETAAKPPELPAAKPAVALPGRIARVDALKERVAVDLRPQDGIKAGDRLKVTREGKNIGTIVVSELQAWGSWATPLPGTPIEEFQKGDTVVPPADK